MVNGVQPCTPYTIRSLLRTNQHLTTAGEATGRNVVYKLAHKTRTKVRKTIPSVLLLYATNATRGMRSRGESNNTVQYIGSRHRVHKRIAPHLSGTPIWGAAKPAHLYNRMVSTSFLITCRQIMIRGLFTLTNTATASTQVHSADSNKIRRRCRIFNL